MSWEIDNSTVFHSEGNSGYSPIIGSTDFRDTFEEGHVVRAYKDYLNDWKEGFENTIEECDERDTWNIRFYEGCIEAIDGIASIRNHGTFNSIAEDCEFRLQEVDHDSTGVDSGNAYWFRYFEGMVQTLTEIKKQCERWDEIMQWKQAFEENYD